jgi:hypothetical protein
VSYGELHEAGVELPASVVCELELAGVAIERCLVDGRRAIGVRLDPANDPGARPAPDPAERPLPGDTEPDSEWSSVEIYRASGLEGLFLGILGRLSWPSGKGGGVGRHGAGERIRETATRPARARDRSQAPATKQPFRANSKRRVLAVGALLAGIAVVSAVIAIWAPGSDRRTTAPIAKRPPSRVLAAARHSRPPLASRPTPQSPPSGGLRSTPQSPSVPVSPALANELEARGHSLLNAGRYGDAVPVLRRAVAATGETLGGCLEPVSSTCLTYAYALYDLGRAVRLSGEPQAAVPILERRLQIDNQRGAVGAELQLARQGIS